MTNGKKSREARANVPDEVPTHEPIQIVNRIDAAILDAMPAPDRVGAVLAMADNAFGLMMAEHGGELDGMNLVVEKATLAADEESGMPPESLYVITFELHRPFGWVNPNEAASDDEHPTDPRDTGLKR